jgi:ubiquinone/menaquinone biosynthesis C-methylase UbiE
MLDKKNVLKTFSNRSQVVLELGCGLKKKYEDSIAIDIVDMPSVDIVADLNQGLKFIPDNSVDIVYTSHFLEHVQNFEFIMNEIYRVLKKGGQNQGVVPHFSSPYYYSDYTHKFYFGLYTFSYFSKEPYFKREVPSYYNSVNFSIKEIRLILTSRVIVIAVIKKILTIMINLSRYTQEVYEENFCYLFPASEIRFVLIKK